MSDVIGPDALDDAEALEIIPPAELGVAGLVGHSRLGPLGAAVVCQSESAFNQHFGDWEEAGLLAASVHGFFQNGGQRCVVLNLGPEERALAPTDLEALSAQVDIEIVAAPGKVEASDHETLLAHAAQTGTRMALLDGPAELETVLSRLRPPRGRHGAFYVPWLLAHDPVNRQLTRVPPSGFMAGLMARVARERGPHKAPANEVIQGIAGLSHRITQAEQDILHPRNINAIRKLPHLEGVRPWGAKTLAERDPFRTIAAFRVYGHVVRSIEQGTTWLVGAGSEPETWARLETAARAFLETVRVTGALVGDSPEQAFRLRCDAETNPPAQRARHIAVMSIGLALETPGRFFTFDMGLDLNPD